MAPCASLTLGTHPAELKLRILKCIPDFQTLAFCIHASPDLYAVYSNNRQAVQKCIIVNIFLRSSIGSWLLKLEVLYTLRLSRFNLSLGREGPPTRKRLPEWQTKDAIESAVDALRQQLSRRAPPAKLELDDYLTLRCLSGFRKIRTDGNWVIYVPGEAVKRWSRNMEGFHKRLMRVSKHHVYIRPGEAVCVGELG